MTTIFANITDLRKFITIDISSDLNVIMPYLVQAEKYIRDITGNALFNAAVEYVNDEEATANPELDALLPFLQYPLANFGYFHAIDKLNVNVGNAGITVASTASLVPASKERIDRLRESVEQSGYDGLERLIEFLEGNVNDYPQWESSSAYSYNKQFFINNAYEFEKKTHKKISRIKFLKLREFISIAENYIKGITCENLFNEIKDEILSNDISAENQILLKIIQPAVCFYAMNKYEENRTYELESTRLLEKLKIYLIQHAEDYPLFLNSDCFSDTEIELNDDDSGLYAFGL